MPMRRSGADVPVFKWAPLFLLLLCASSRSSEAQPRRGLRVAKSSYQYIQDPAKLSQLLKESRPAPLRVKFDYSALHSSTALLTQQQVKNVEQVLGPATSAILAKYLQARVPQSGPLKGPIQDDAKRYCGFDMPQGLSEGIPDTDILMVVTSNKKDCTGSAYAVGGSCDWDPITNRPTLGSVSVCRHFFTQTEEEQLATLLHEVVHALGFVSGWYEYMYDQDTGQPYTKVLQKSSEKGKPAYLVTPRATAYARSYFGCPTLPGAPLDGESESHWHQRAIALDFMVPRSIDTLQPSRITPFTLALLEDSGWYAANYSAAEEPEHGRGAGCAFVESDCKTYRAGDPANNYICPASLDQADACTPDYRGLAWCGTGQGGCIVPMVDVKVWPEWPLLDCTDADSFSTLPSSKQQLALIHTLGGSVGPNSRCLRLESAVCSKGGKCIDLSNTTRMAMCANVKCNGDGTQVVVSFRQPVGGTAQVKCSRGSTVQLANALPSLFSSGAFACPDPSVVCPTLGCPAACTAWGRGHCWNKQCTCRYMYAGPTCNTSLL